MEKRSWKPITDYLDNLDKLEPLPTGISEDWQPNGNIRACIFDIYGTLIISSSGDIDQAEFSSQSLEMALERAHIELCASGPLSRQTIGQKLLEDFRREIEKQHSRMKKQGIPYPEITITSIWRRILKNYHKANKIGLNKHSDVKIYTFLFELMSNRIYPMPHMRQVLNHLSENGMPLGIISNAQFYTPMIMNHFLDGPLSETTHIRHFEPRLSIYSYQAGRSKPDMYLFRILTERLESHYGIKPEEALFVGNDMYKDIWPASQAGLKTALFAGDRRSLRLRQDHREVRNLRPDFIIKDLISITGILGQPLSHSKDIY